MYDKEAGINLTVKGAYSCFLTFPFVPFKIWARIVVAKCYPQAKCTCWFVCFFFLPFLSFVVFRIESRDSCILGLCHIIEPCPRVFTGRVYVGMVPFIHALFLFLKGCFKDLVYVYVCMYVSRFPRGPKKA